jgi:hypothetical protein
MRSSEAAAALLVHQPTMHLAVANCTCFLLKKMVAAVLAATVPQVMAGAGASAASKILRAGPSSTEVALLCRFLKLFR